MANPQDLAEKVAAKAATVLLPLELEIRNWPAEFRAIIWDAVALTAAQHRSDANAAKQRGE